LGLYIYDPEYTRLASRGRISPHLVYQGHHGNDGIYLGTVCKLGMMVAWSITNSYF